VRTARARGGAGAHRTRRCARRRVARSQASHRAMWCGGMFPRQRRRGQARLSRQHLALGTEIAKSSRCRVSSPRPDLGRRSAPCVPCGHRYKWWYLNADRPRRQSNRAWERGEGRTGYRGGPHPATRGIVAGHTIVGMYAAHVYAPSSLSALPSAVGSWSSRKCQFILLSCLVSFADLSSLGMGAPGSTSCSSDCEVPFLVRVLRAYTLPALSGPRYTHRRSHTRRVSAAKSKKSGQRLRAQAAGVACLSAVCPFVNATASAGKAAREHTARTHRRRAPRPTGARARIISPPDKCARIISAA
jgi:hypothetical protein